MIIMQTLITISLFLLSCVLQETLVSTECAGSGFPVEWTNETDTIYWYVTPIIKRQFTAAYRVTDYYIETGLVIGASPSCLDEFYDPTTGYYYYLMYYGDENIYSLDKGLDICHGYKQFDNVIREFYHEFVTRGTITSANDCVGLFTSSSSTLALSKLNFEFANCPFEFATYNFTFSDSGNPDYCAGKTSEAYIGDKVIALNSCYDPHNVTSGTPYYGPFSCLGSWQAEERDTISFGDFIVIEMYNDAHWPYCGRYKVDENGVITLSIYLSMSQGDWFPVMCISSVDNEFMYDDGTQKFVRMVFTLPSSPTVEGTTQVEPTTATTKPTTTSPNLMTASKKPTTYKPFSSKIESTPIESKTVTNVYRTEGMTTVQQKVTTVLTSGSTNIPNNTITLKSSGFPYWWILVGVMIPLLSLIAGSLIYAAKNGKGNGKVDSHNQEEGSTVR